MTANQPRSALPNKWSNEWSNEQPTKRPNDGSEQGRFEIDIRYSIRPDEAREPVEVPVLAALDEIPLEKEAPLYFLSVNYYSAALLSDLMHTLDANQGIVIVNNSPLDRTVHGLAGQYYAGGEVIVIDAPANGGFGAGCNLGLQWIYARSPNALVWLINPDTCLMPSATSTVRQCFRQQVQERDIAILGTPVLDLNGKIWFAAGQFNRWTGSVTSLAAAQRDCDRTKPVPTRWVSGCSMVLNLSALGHCPQFDDIYFLYYEDCDLCERYFQQGHVIAIAPAPLVVHAVSSITGRHPNPKYVHATFSKLTFLRRHATPLALCLNLIYLSAQSVLLRSINPALARGRWTGITHFFRGERTHPHTSSNSSPTPVG